jgi:hypothetical protein
MITSHISRIIIQFQLKDSSFGSIKTVWYGEIEIENVKLEVNSLTHFVLNEYTKIIQ